MNTTIILIILAVILGILYLLKRKARLKKQAKKEI